MLLVDIDDYIEVEISPQNPYEDEKKDDLNLPINKTIKGDIQQIGYPCKEILIYFYYERFSMREIVERIPELKNENNVRKRKFSCIQ